MKTGHLIKNCKWKKTCNIQKCKKLHNRLLHLTDKLNKVQDLTQNCNCRNNLNKGYKRTIHSQDMNVSNCLFKIISVTIYGREKAIQEYAFIDEGSDTSLIDFDLLTDLEIPCEQSDELHVKWFNGRSTSQKTYKVDIKISSVIDKDTKFNLSNLKAIKNFDLPSQTIDISEL